MNESVLPGQLAWSTWKELGISPGCSDLEARLQSACLTVLVTRDAKRSEGLSETEISDSDHREQFVPDGASAAADCYLGYTKDGWQSGLMHRS